VSGFHADEEAQPSHVADDGIRVQGGGQPFEEHLALGAGPIDQTQLLDPVENGQADGGPDGMMGPGEAVDQPARVGDGVVDGTVGDRQPERPVARGGAFCRDEQIGAKPEVIRGEPLAGAPEPGHDLVGEDEDPVASAYLGDRFPVAVWRDRRPAGGASDRLGDEDRHPLRPPVPDRVVQRVGVESVTGIGMGGIGTAIFAHSRDPDGLAEPRLVGPSQRLPARDVQGATGVAVIRRASGDYHASLGFSPGQVVGPGHL
jgi:hypothetical protein